MGWTHKVTLDIAHSPGSVTYLQDFAFVPAKAGHGAVYLMAQAINSDRDTRFRAYNSSGHYLNAMIVKGGGHGASFHAYRSAAGNLYVLTWVNGHAYRIRWQPGKTVRAGHLGTGAKSLATTRRPVGSYEPFFGLRVGHAHSETFSLHSRFEYLDEGHRGAYKGRAATIPKHSGYTTQSCAVREDRFYRIIGATNKPAGHGSRKHLVERFGWDGRLERTIDVTDLVRAGGATSDEPEGLSFSGTPGRLIVGKRAGGSKAHRTYDLFEV